MQNTNPAPTTFKTIWKLVRPYWASEERWRARATLGAIIALSLGQVYISVLLNKWNAEFYNALQDKNLPEFWHQLGIFCVLAVAFIIAAVYRQYLTQLLHIAWRRWLTVRIQGDWLANRNFYRLQVIEQRADNPDQRIADDIDGFTGTTLSLGIDLLSSVVTLCSFVTILWGLSGDFSLTLGGHTLAIPGYMVWAALLYAAVGTLVAHKIGRRLIGLNFEQQKREADYRFALVRLRENAEPIAFYGGEAAENATLRERFMHVVSNWRAIMQKQKQLTWFTSGYAQIANIFPILVAAPRYFSGAIQLGGLMQIASAFGQVQDALSWLINVYPSFANWKATVNRLQGFTAALYREQPEAALAVERTNDSALTLHEISVRKPDGAALITSLSKILPAGSRLLVQGPSGSGKTTLLRLLAGLWPYGGGSLSLPSNATLLFVPQRPYLPLGTLRAALSYPQPVTHFADADLTAALTAVGLGAIAIHFDNDDNWAQCLSPGEQQKLGFVRVLLAKPSILLLDEATAALDSDSEAALYKRLIATLPQTIIISVGHRPSLAAFHTDTLTL